MAGMTEAQDGNSEPGFSLDFLKPGKHALFFIISQRDYEDISQEDHDEDKGQEDRTKRDIHTFKAKQLKKFRDQLLESIPKNRILEYPNPPSGNPTHVPEDTRLIKENLKKSQVVVLFHSQAFDASGWCNHQVKLATILRKNGDPTLFHLVPSDLLDDNSVEEAVKRITRVIMGKAEPQISLSLERGELNFLRLHMLIARVATPAVRHLLEIRVKDAPNVTKGELPFEKKLVSHIKRNQAIMSKLLPGSQLVMEKVVKAENPELPNDFSLLKDLALSSKLFSNNEELLSEYESGTEGATPTKKPRKEKRKREVMPHDLRNWEKQNIHVKAIKDQRDLICHYKKLSEFTTGYYDEAERIIMEESMALLQDDTLQTAAARKTEGQIQELTIERYGELKAVNDGLGDAFEQLTEVLVNREVKPLYEELRQFKNHNRALFQMADRIRSSEESTERAGLIEGLIESVLGGVPGHHGQATEQLPHQTMQM